MIKATECGPLPGPAWKRSFRRRLLVWFARHQRDLPWRKTKDPYRVWVSEIMLQQTQVATVVPYFERFVASFPTAQALADASERDVLRHWEGLGYYRRARQLHRAAQVITAEHAGMFPRDIEAARTLPGVGRYTAGAIASIAYDLPAPILEANTVRLFCRLIAFRGNASSSAGQRLLWGLAQALLPRRHSGRFNQALMELGSLVCTPRSPDCPRCPAAELCRASQLGAQAEIPHARAKPQTENLREAAVIVWRRGKVLVRQCPPGERWAGLWDFPRVPLSGQRRAKLDLELSEKVRHLVGVEAAIGERLTILKHGVTRFRITLECYEAEYRGGVSNAGQRGVLKWLCPTQLADYPLSVTGRKLARMLTKSRSGVVSKP